MVFPPLLERCRRCPPFPGVVSKPAARKKVPGRPFAKGADARRGRGPAKGAPNAGRPPKLFKEFLEAVRSNPDAQDALLKAAKDPDSKNFGNAWKVLTDYDDAKPAAKKAMTGTFDVTVRVQREGRRVTAS